MTRSLGDTLSCYTIAYLTRTDLTRKQSEIYSNLENVFIFDQSFCLKFLSLGTHSASLFVLCDWMSEWVCKCRKKQSNYDYCYVCTSKYGFITHSSINIYSIYIACVCKCTNDYMSVWSELPATKRPSQILADGFIVVVGPLVIQTSCFKCQCY